VGFIVFLNSL